MSSVPKILVINPGSTTTKIAVYQDEICLMRENINHFLEELISYPSIISQYEYRLELIVGALAQAGIDLNEIKIVMGRGGLTYPLESGVYEVNDRMITHVRKGVLGEHASNLGPIIANALAKKIPDAKAYIADPVVTDEILPIARVSGHPRFERRSIFHALNQKAVARTYAEKIKKQYEDINLIIAHMGGGISIGAHDHGRVIDVNNALDGEGPFSPERSGTLPVGQLIEACYCGNFTKEEMQQMVVGEGGMVAYLNTNSIIDIEKNALDGDELAKFYLDALVYQVAKGIGEMAAVLKGDIDVIILTGGIAYSKYVTGELLNRIGFLSKIEIFPGEDELASLALNARMMLNGDLSPKKYPH